MSLASPRLRTRAHVHLCPLWHTWSGTPRITEQVRLEGTTVCHLVQPPCSSKATLEPHGTESCPDNSGVSPVRETPQSLCAAFSSAWSLHSKEVLACVHFISLCYSLRAATFALCPVQFCMTSQKMLLCHGPPRTPGVDSNKKENPLSS